MADGQRRKLLVSTALLLLAPAFTRAQRERLHRIGFVSPTRPDSRNEAFLQGLRELGYFEGRNCLVEMRFAEGQTERFPALIEELIRQEIDVLVVGATIGARAAKKATSTIPVVFAGSSDPVGGGVVANLARPGGNITGFSTAYGDGFAAKWLELLKEAVPAVGQVAALWSSSNVAAARFVAELQGAARSMNVRLEAYDAKNPAELRKALAEIGSSGARGLIVAPSPFAVTQRDRLVGFAAERRLAAMYFVEDFADAGGLMAYGPSITDSYRKAASHVDKILRGARPGDLPVEQPTKFELVVNLRTARALDLKVPQTLLLRADRVIE